MQRETRSRKKGKTRVKQTPLDVFSLLKTNHITAPHERPLIEASIETCRLEIESAEEEIRRLHEKQATYESIIELHHNLLRPSPIRTLPPEILSDIFAVYCDMHQLSDSPDPSSSSSWVSCPNGTFLQSRVHLLGICRRWREVALSTPRLWNTFVIIRRGAELNRKWLASAGTLPVELSYHIKNNKHAHQLLSVYLPRCEKLHLHIPNGSDVDSLYQIPRASRLTTLTLRFPSQADDWLHSQPWTDSLLQNVPALTSLTTNASPEVLSPLATQLSELILLDAIRPLHVLPYLRILKRLKSIRFDRLYTHHGMIPFEQEPITHEHLESLHSKYARPFMDDQLENLLNHLILPRLRHLDLKPYSFCPESLMKLFERSSCEIRSLALDIRWPHPRHRHLSDAETEDGLAECLKSPQVGKHLEKFCFIMRDSSDTQIQIPDTLLRLLSEPTGHFLKLAELHFSSTSAQVPQILDLIRNRATNYGENGVSQLKRLEVQYMNHSYGEPYLSEHDIVTLRKTGTSVEMKECRGEA